MTVTVKLATALILAIVVLSATTNTIVMANDYASSRKDIRIRTVTAYSEIDSCHYDGCPMASGKRAYVGAVACPRGIELGTRILINNEEYVCEDRYAKHLSDRFDIFVGYGEESYYNAKEFGVKKLTVSILK